MDGQSQKGHWIVFHHGYNVPEGEAVMDWGGGDKTHFIRRSSRWDTKYSRGITLWSNMEGKQLKEKQRSTRFLNIKSFLHVCIFLEYTSGWVSGHVW